MSSSDFELFLEKKDLQCTSRIGPDPEHFGNMIVEYVGAHIAIRIESDRGRMLLWVQDPTTRGDTWYSVSEILQLLTGSGGNRLQFWERVRFLEENWDAVAGLFNPARREESHQQLERIRRAILSNTGSRAQDPPLASAPRVSIETRFTVKGDGSNFDFNAGGKPLG